MPAQERRSGAYKRHLGGGADAWQSRGRFQLDLLRWLGLTPRSTLLDVGCGPLRAGVHLIDFLAPRGYWGFDSTADFVEIAQGIVDESGLAAKAPMLRTVRDFDLASLEREFDVVLAFSVLNHCSTALRRTFFEQAPAVMHETSRGYLTHAWWFADSYLDGTGITAVRQITQLPFDIGAYGWAAGETMLPILEIRRSA